MFGQSMAAFIPAMIEGVVFFMSGYAARDVIHLIRRRRISVLVCIPQMLELLRSEIEHAVPESRDPRRGSKWYWSWWQYRRVHRRFGWKFWSFVVGAAPLDPDLEEFWRKLGFEARLEFEGTGRDEKVTHTRSCQAAALIDDRNAHRVK